MKPNKVSISTKDEAYWETIRNQYSVSPAFINLENAYCGVLAKPVLSAYQQYQVEINRETSLFLRTKLHDKLGQVKLALAEFCGINEDELLITRSLSEAMRILFENFPFKQGDEILYADVDYDSVQNIIEDLAARKKLRAQKIFLSKELATNESIVSAYENAISVHTRVLLLTHILHRNGQILPVRQITEMAKHYGVDVIVDAAHSFALLDYRFPDLGCDFIGVNLHKWLGAPLGTGLLYIRKNRHAELISKVASKIDDLLPPGTTSPAAQLAIIDALRLHQSIGTHNIEQRLRYLSKYWIQQTSEISAIKHHTFGSPNSSCAIQAISVEGVRAQELVDYLMNEHRIFTVVRRLDGHEFVRITPHIMTRISELDLLIGALKKLVANLTSPRSHASRHSNLKLLAERNGL